MDGEFCGLHSSAVNASGDELGSSFKADMLQAHVFVNARFLARRGWAQAVVEGGVE